MNTTRAAAPRHWWDVTFAAVAVGIALLINGLGVGAARTSAFAALAVVVLCWLPLGRRAVVGSPSRPTAHGIAFTGVLALALLVLSASVPMTTFFLGFACPYAWASTRKSQRLLGPVMGNMALCAAASLGLWANSGWAADELLSSALNGLVSFLFSLSMGLWMTRVAMDAEERGRLRAQLDATNLELVEAHRQAGAARERERFAHEIHDTLTQTLTAVVMLAERARSELESGEPATGTATLATAERTARQALAETRSLIAEGRGTQLGGKSFVQRIADVCARFGAESGIEVETEIGGELDSLPRADQVVLLRCLQEVLSNVRKHARAATVTVEMFGGADSSYLAVTDDGVGFPDGVEAATARGYGLAGIASRLALSTGTMTITTGEEGTRVSITLPGKAHHASNE